MFDRSLVTSGFDTETLISEDYLTNVLLAQVEAGSLPLTFDFAHPESGLPVHVQIHPPTDYTRRYVSVDELEGVMRFENPDDYWTMSTSVAGPVAEFVASLSQGQVDAIRATLDPTLVPFERDGGLDLPWLTSVT